MSTLSVVVGGSPLLADALEPTGQFRAVHRVASGDEFRELIAEGILSGSKDDLIFLFADNFPGTALPLTTILQKLTLSEWKVIIVGLTASARDLAKTYPHAGLLEGPFTLNSVLGAMGGMGIDNIVASENGHGPLNLDPNTTQWTPPPAAPEAPSPAQSGWEQPPVIPAPEPQPQAVSAPESTAPTQAPVNEAVPPAPSQWSPTPEPQPPSAPPPQPTPEQEVPQAGWGRPLAPTPDTPPQDTWTPAPVAPPAPAQDSWAPAPVATPAPQDTWTPAPVAPVAPPAPAQDPWAPAPAAPQDTWTPAPVAPPAPQDTWTPATQETPWGTPDPSPIPVPSAPEAPAWGPQPRDGFVPVAPQRRNGRVILVTAPKGGTGKSSLALNLTTYLGLRQRELPPEDRRRVCIVDANIQQADTGKYLRVYQPDITTLARDPNGRTPEAIERYLVTKPEYNISALLGPAVPEDASPMFINASLYNAAVDALRERFDYIIVDSPVAELYHGLFSDFALPQADFIVVPIAPNMTTIYNTEAWLRNVTKPKYANGPGVDPSTIGLVLNRFEDNIDCDEDQVRENLASWNYIGKIPETKEWKIANNRNELVATYNVPEINEAFAQILYAATGEQFLLAGQQKIAPEKPSFLSKLKEAFRK